MNNFYIYGRIDDWTAQDFARYFNYAQGSALTIHINSAGGEIFAALTIYNLIKDKSNVTIKVEGLCASAATLICCGAKVTAAKNSLFMLHLPLVELDSLYNEKELAKLQDELAKVKGAVISTYQNKIAKEPAEIENILSDETWLTAADAQNLGLIEEISGEEVQMTMDAGKKILFVNQLNIEMARYKIPQEVLKMEENQAAMEKFKASILMADRKRSAALNALRTGSAVVNSIINKAIENGDDVDKVQQKLTAENQRIAALNELRNDSPAVNSIINKAIDTGDDVEKIRVFVNAIKESEPEKPRYEDKLYNLLKDNLDSGAAEVMAASSPPTEAEKQAAFADSVAKYANEIIKGGVM